MVRPSTVTLGEAGAFLVRDTRGQKEAGVEMQRASLLPAFSIIIVIVIVAAAVYCVWVLCLLVCLVP